ncbi:MptD family putative ECF transporter S component [Actinomyces israelii]|uniref:MptD family putative ECF transporter S component n=2 Tax=Actinomyces israelii TaxID=1659 RepID=A0ABT4IC30_9ACTO|nr:MptD family putative ECF transporter S component [Actinomyces israelii]
MSGRDLMTIGIFLAIYIVLYFAITMFGFLNPVMMLVTLGLSIVVGAIPFMLFLTRVKHAGMVALFAIVLGILLLVIGFPPLSIGILVSLAVVVELVLAVTGYRSRWAGVLSYTIFSVWNTAPLLPLFYDRQGYFSSPSMSRMGPEYTARLDAFLSTGVLIGFDIAAVVLGLIGGVIALRLLRKSFARAGLA